MFGIAGPQVVIAPPQRHSTSYSVLHNAIRRYSVVRSLYEGAPAATSYLSLPVGGIVPAFETHSTWSQQANHPLLFSKYLCTKYAMGSFLYHMELANAHGEENPYPRK
jgi:hypothetical protein